MWNVRLLSPQLCADYLNGHRTQTKVTPTQFHIRGQIFVADYSISLDELKYHLLLYIYILLLYAFSRVPTGNFKKQTTTFSIIYTKR